MQRTHRPSYQEPQQRAIPAALLMLEMLRHVVAVQGLAGCFGPARESLRDGEDGVRDADAAGVAPPGVAVLC